MLDLDALDFAKGGGVVTVVAQDADTGAVLMVAAADREAVTRTVATGEMHYTSRTRGLWHKGATTGNRQRVVSLAADCDGDAVLARVESVGPACHTGARSCFGESAFAPDAVAMLDCTIADRVRNLAAPAPIDTSYTRRLLLDRNLRLKKVGEEAAELITACADGAGPRAASEAADLLYHTLVALRAIGADWAAVARELATRQRRSACRSAASERRPRARGVRE